LFIQAIQRRFGRLYLRRTVAGALALGVVLAAAACGGDDDASAVGSNTGPTDLTIAIASTSTVYGVTYFADQQGIFKKYNLNVTIQQLTPSAAAAAFASGSVDLVSAGTAALDVSVKRKSGKLIIDTGYSDFQVVADPSITSPAQLKGKTIASTSPGGTNDYVGRAFLEQQGLDPEKDVKIVYLGSDNAVVAAIPTGQVDAVVVPVPGNLLAEAAGFKTLADVGDLNIRNGFQATDKLMKENPEAVKNYLRAMVEATDAALADPELAKQVLAKAIGDNDPTRLQYQVDAYKEIWRAEPFSDEQATRALAAVAKTNPAAAQLKPADVADNSFINEVLAERK
jgi:NitT/TauT family transport system substrate-binding protein